MRTLQETLHAQSKTSGIPLWRLWLRMLRLSFRGIMPYEAVSQGFVLRSGRFAGFRHITQMRTHFAQDKLLLMFLRDKGFFRTLLLDSRLFMHLPKQVSMEEENIPFVVKIAHGSQGKGITVVTREKNSYVLSRLIGNQETQTRFDTWDAVKTNLLSTYDGIPYVCEALVEPVKHCVTLKGVQYVHRTYRIITMNVAGKTQVLAVNTKFTPMSEPIKYLDNTNIDGNLAISYDFDTYQLHDIAVESTADSIVRFHDTPMRDPPAGFQAAINLAFCLSDFLWVRGFKDSFVGWDIMVAESPEGYGYVAKVLEGNGRPSVAYLQLSTGQYLGDLDPSGFLSSKLSTQWEMCDVWNTIRVGWYLLRNKDMKQLTANLKSDFYKVVDATSPFN